MFRHEQLTDRLEVVFCDWKRLHVGWPVHDLAFLMMSCAPKSLARNSSADQVMEKYLFTYTETMKKLGVDFKETFPDFGVDDLRQDYEDALLPAFLQVNSINK